MCLAIPGKVLEKSEENGLVMGLIDFAGTRNKACLTYTPEAEVGDYVIVHAGFRPADAQRGRGRGLAEGTGPAGGFMEDGNGHLLKYLDEFRDPELAKGLLAEIERTVTQPWVIMEICGGQTHAIMRYGIDQLLPPEITLVHGPGCPVCVTPLETIDRALAIAARDEVIFTSFGDMLRVPGSSDDLFRVKSRGGDVRMVYSPLEAVKLARENPDREVVFLAVGFETTAPGNAMAVKQAAAEGLTNFSAKSSATCWCRRPWRRSCRRPPTGAGIPGRRPRVHHHGLGRVRTHRRQIPGADRAHRVRAGGHPRGHPQNRAAARKRRPRAWRTSTCARSGKQGNPAARAVVDEVYEVCDRKWRGIGTIPGSGLKIRDELAAFDAEKKFQVEGIVTEEPAVCISRRDPAGPEKTQRVPGLRH